MGAPDNPAAFPFVATPDCYHVSEGMTLRDLFAGLAVIAGLPETAFSIANQAQEAYEFADAMLAERSKVQP